MQQSVSTFVARSIVQFRGAQKLIAQTAGLRFARVKSRAELVEVGHFRRGLYAAEASAYLLRELDPDGLDSDDARAFVYVARSENRIVGTVRAVPAPFEVERFLGPGGLVATLEGRPAERFVEVSRMLIAPGMPPGVGSALTAFGGFDLLLHTPYRGYLAYVRDRSESDSDPDARSTRFRIPERGTHMYTVVSGFIGLDLLWAGIGKTRRAAGRKTRSPRHWLEHHLSQG